jgi:hypothetical protein
MTEVCGWVREGKDRECTITITTINITTTIIINIIIYMYVRFFSPLPNRMNDFAPFLFVGGRGTLDS